MAKVLLSALLDALTGQLAGSVFQLGPGGLQVRSKVSPRNPRTTSQQLTRSRYSYARLLWPLLTQVQRDTWIAASPTDLQASAFFVAVNQMIGSAGQPLLESYTGGIASVLDNNAFNTINPGSFIIGATTIEANLAANVYLSIFATRPLSPGALFISPSDYILIGNAVPTAPTGSPIDITTKYLDKYGVLPEAYLVGVKYYTVNVATGGFTAPEFVQGYIQPAP